MFIKTILQRLNGYYKGEGAKQLYIVKNMVKENTNEYIVYKQSSDINMEIL